jgi:tellurite resistance protein
MEFIAQAAFVAQTDGVYSPDVWRLLPIRVAQTDGFDSPAEEEVVRVVEKSSMKRT